MVKFYLMLLLTLVMSAPISAQRMLNVNDGEFSPELCDPTVKKSVTPIDGGYHVKYVFEKALFVPDDIYPETETMVYNGFVTNGAPEMPSFPYSSDSFSIPAGYEAYITNVNEDIITVKSNPAPGRLPKFVSDPSEYTAENVKPVDSGISGLYPPQAVTDNGRNVYNGVTIANIGIIPVRYQVSSGDAVICKSIEYDILFNPTGIPTALSYESNDSKYSAYFDDPFLSAATINWDWEKKQFDIETAASTDGSQILTTKKYLIISATTYKEQVEKFIEWKKTLGFNAKALYKDNWTSDEILAAVKGETNLSYLLLVGNNNQVPGKEINFSFVGTVITDIMYSCPNHTTGNYVPEISCGRLPVNTADECETVIDKIMGYEKNPVNSASFYNTDLFLTYYQGTSKTNMRNSQTTYEISQYVENQGNTVLRKFKANDSSSPSSWKDPGIDENGELKTPCPVPSFLKKPAYQWNAGATEIINAINDGCARIFYFGHGLNNQWNDPEFKTSHMTNLTNGKELPIVFSMACMTGNYKSQGSLVEKFLTHKDGGAVGVFGYTNSTAETFTDVMSLSLYNGLYPSPGIKSIITIDPYQSINFWGTKKSITELGALHKLSLNSIYEKFGLITLNSMVDYRDDEVAMFTLFGDPSMNIYLESPTQYKPLLVQDGTSYSISAPSPYVITTYDKKTGINMNYSGKATFKLPSDPSQFVICVHAPGHKPYIIESSSIRKAAKGTTDENKLVREDRIWRYYTPSVKDSDSYKEAYLNLCFDGTSEIDDKTYYNCYVWQEGKEYTDENVALIAYMREENGDIFARYIPEVLKDFTTKDIRLFPFPVTFPIWYTEDEFNKYVNEEYLLYKPGLYTGDVFYSTEDETVIFREFQVTYQEEVECFSEYRDLWVYGCTNDKYRYNYIDGVGCVYGLLPFANSKVIFISEEPWSLIEVVDLYGNKIFSWNDSSLSVDSIQNNSETVRVTYHNLQGVEVTDPATPGIYVKTSIYSNGTKKSEKIFIK